MLSFLTMLAAGFAYEHSPGIALILGCVAVWGAKSWSVRGTDVLELIFFYGALIGCGVVWFG